MAKRNGKTKTEDEGDDGSARRSNGFKPDVVKSFVARVEQIKDDIESERGEFMATVKQYKNDIADILEEAKGEGIPTRELKAAIRMRDLERKKEKVRNGLESEQQDTLDQIRLALGDLDDTPLGAAAMAHAEQAQAGAH